MPSPKVVPLLLTDSERSRWGTRAQADRVRTHCVRRFMR